MKNSDRQTMSATAKRCRAVWRQWSKMVGGTGLAPLCCLVLGGLTELQVIDPRVFLLGFLFTCIGEAIIYGERNHAAAIWGIYGMSGMPLWMAYANGDYSDVVRFHMGIALFFLVIGLIPSVMVVFVPESELPADLLADDASGARAVHSQGSSSTADKGRRPLKEETP